MNEPDLVRVIADHRLKGFSGRDYAGWTETTENGRKTVHGYWIERSRLDEAIRAGAAPAPLRTEK